MTRDDARLRRLLDEERAQLLADLADFAKTEYQHVGVSTHMADDATAAFDQASGLALQQQLEHRLHRVDHTLTKFEQGTYGYCENCGQPIDFARLTALPDARFCLKCQRKREVPSSHTPGPRAYEQGNMLNTNGKDQYV